MLVSPPIPVEQPALAILPDDIRILEQLVQGRTLEEAGVNTSFLLRVMKEPSLGSLFQRAREMSSYSMEEEAIARLRRATEVKLTTPELRAIDLLVQQLRWSAIKRNPTVYSERAAVNVTVPIQIHTTLDMGDGISNATKEFPNIYEVTAELKQEMPIAEIPDSYLDQLERTAIEASSKEEDRPPSEAEAGSAAGATGVEAVVGQSDRSKKDQSIPGEKAQPRRPGRTGQARKTARSRGDAGEVQKVVQSAAGEGAQ